jgi:hypothetical protein
MVNRTNHNRFSKDIVNEKLEHRNIVLIGEYKNANTKTLFLCDNNHTWESIPSNVLRGSGCPHCAGLFKLSSDMIDERLTCRGITILGTYLNDRTRTVFGCICGHRWKAVPNKVFFGRGCPECNQSKSGFDSNKPAIFYVVEFSGFIKYGITNSPESRFQSHKRQGMIRIIEQRHFDFGITAKDLEEKIKRQFGGKFVTKSELKDGWTETLPPEVLNELLSILP